MKVLEWVIVLAFALVFLYLVFAFILYIRLRTRRLCCIVGWPDHVRLDAAVPEQVYLERAFDVAAAVRLLDSPLLEEDDLTRVKSGDAHLFWPASEDFIRLRLQIKAPECQIVGDDQYTFLLPKGEDSPVFYFNLIPLHTGDITIIVTLYQEDDAMGNTRVRTIAVLAVAGEVHLSVTSQEVLVDFSDRAMIVAHTLPGLRPSLGKRLRATLTASPHLASDRELQALFVDTRLAPWRNLLPDNTPNRTARVNGLIHTLHDKTNTTGENALVLFLHVLADHTDPADALHTTLTTLAADLERALIP